MVKILHGRELERQFKLDCSPLLAHAIKEQYHDRYVEALSRLNTVLQDIVENLGLSPVGVEVETFRHSIFYEGPAFLREMTEPRWERRQPKENAAP